MSGTQHPLHWSGGGGVADAKSERKVVRRAAWVDGTDDGSQCKGESCVLAGATRGKSRGEAVDTKLAAPPAGWLTLNMNLEDHLGDIIRKGRKAANVPAEAAAKTAGLSVAALAALEESGKVVEQPNLAAL